MTSMLVIMASKEADINLEWVPCINYLLYFQKNTVDIRPLIDSDSKVNIMTLDYTDKLGLKVYSTNVEAQKINNLTF